MQKYLHIFQSSCASGSLLSAFRRHWDCLFNDIERLNANDSKRFLVWYSRSKKIQVPLEDWGKRKFPSYFKINPIILGGEITLLNCHFDQWAGFNLVQFCMPVRGEYEYPFVQMQMKVEAARQERLTVKNFCLASVPLRTPNAFPEPLGRLSNSKFSDNTNPTDSASSRPPAGRQKGWPNIAVVAGRVIPPSQTLQAQHGWSASCQWSCRPPLQYFPLECQECLPAP